MSLPVVLRPLAYEDILQIQAELEAQITGLGDKFLDRLKEVFDRIESMPEMYAEVWETVRAVRLRKFHHVIYYVIFPERVEVIAVIHGSRDSSVWQTRDRDG